MTELDRMRIVENMFPDWREHLNDGKVVDHILDGLTCNQIVLNICSRPGCNNVARFARKTCIECAAKAAQYMRTYGQRKAMNAKKVRATDTHSGRKVGGALAAHAVMREGEDSCAPLSASR